MEQKLKMTTGSAVGVLILLFVLLVYDIVTIGAFFGDPETRGFTFDLLGSYLFLLVISIVISVFVEAYVGAWIYNSAVRPLTFNKDSFTFKGKTYTYHQIEKIKIRIKGYYSVFYDIRVGGKRLYTFDDKYEGSKEFLYYLNSYNVPGTPRG